MGLRSILLILLWAASAAAQQNPPPATRPGGPADGKLPFLEIDRHKRQVRLECEAVNAESALEFLVCLAGTAEHETLLRSKARPSHLHLALLMIGLEPGQPVRFSRALNHWLPPQGPGLRLTCQFDKEGKTISLPAYRLLRNQKTQKEMPPLHWVFVGSRLTEQGDYAADVTGHLVSVVNFEHTPVDIPELKSSNNESLEWEVNPDLAPKRGAKVWLTIEKAEEKGAASDGK